MKITFVMPSFGEKPIGGFKIVFEHANLLSVSGHEVTIVLPRYATTKLEPLGIRGALRNSLMRKYPYNWFCLRPEIKVKFTPSLAEVYIPHGDAVVATSWETAEAVAQYSGNRGTKFYFIQHHETWSGNEARVNATWKLPLHKLVIATWLKDLAESMGEEADLVPNAIDYGVFQVTVPIDTRQPHLGMMYHQADWKGSQDGLVAIDLVRHKHPALPVSLFSVYPRDSQIPPDIEYIQLPSQGRLVDFYNNCSVFVSPSWAEGWPLPPAEAMACGCALVGTDIGGVHDYALDGQTALLSPAKDPESLARNIERLLTDDSLRQKIATNGLQKLQTEFTWEKSTKAMDQALATYETRISP